MLCISVVIIMRSDLMQSRIVPGPSYNNKTKDIRIHMFQHEWERLTGLLAYVNKRHSLYFNTVASSDGLVLTMGTRLTKADGDYILKH